MKNIFKNMTLNERRNFVRTFLLQKYSGIWQKSCESKKKTLTKKFTKIVHKPLSEMVIALSDNKFRKKFKLNKVKRKFISSEKLLKHFKFGQ